MSRYLFQSWVRISEGTAPAKVWPVERSGRGPGPCGGACAGMTVVRWYFAETGVRRSKRRMWESEETQEIIAGLVGEKEAE